VRTLSSLDPLVNTTHGYLYCSRASFNTSRTPCGECIVLNMEHEPTTHATPPADDSGPLLLTPAAAATRLGIGLKTVRQLIHSGELRHIAVGRKMLVPTMELTAWLRRKLDEEDGPWTT